ncbi:MAG: RNA polymerase sigma factor [Bacteroidales bacterium]|nr:RNA polymerase sigma factor [Bacteroidales bacterium]
MNINEYNKCVDKFSDQVYRFLLKSIRNEFEAKDLVQDTFEKLWIKRKEIEMSKAKSYIFTCAYHEMIDHIRKNKNNTDLSETDKLSQTIYNQYSDIQEILQLALNKMKPEQRSVILLRDLEGYSYDEIAEITGLSLSAVKVYIFRGRLFLKTFLEKSHVLSLDDLED